MKKYLLTILAITLVVNSAWAKKKPAPPTTPPTPAPILNPISIYQARQIIKLVDPNAAPELFIGTWQRVLIANLQGPDQTISGYYSDTLLPSFIDGSIHQLKISKVENKWLPEGENSDVHLEETNILMNSPLSRFVARPTFDGRRLSYTRNRASWNYRSDPKHHFGSAEEGGLTALGIRDGRLNMEKHIENNFHWDGYAVEISCGLLGTDVNRMICVARHPGGSRRPPIGAEGDDYARFAIGFARVQ